MLKFKVMMSRARCYIIVSYRAKLLTQERKCAILYDNRYELVYVWK